MQQKHNVERCIGQGDLQCGHHIQGLGGRTAGACRVAQGHRPPCLGHEDGLHMEGKVGPGWPQNSGSNWINACWCGVER